MEAPLIETYYVAALAAIFGAAVGAAAVAGRKAPGTPKAYVVTEVDVTGDKATFQRDYAAHAQATIEPFGGRYLVRGGRNIGLRQVIKAPASKQPLWLAPGSDQMVAIS